MIDYYLQHAVYFLTILPIICFAAFYILVIGWRYYIPFSSKLTIIGISIVFNYLFPKILYEMKYPIISGTFFIFVYYLLFLLVIYPWLLSASTARNKKIITYTERYVIQIFVSTILFIISVYPVLFLTITNSRYLISVLILSGYLGMLHILLHQKRSA